MCYMNTLAHLSQYDGINRAKKITLMIQCNVILKNI